MGNPRIVDACSGRRRDDRLSNLGDVLLGHILSFLDAKEAARAAALSSRWRDVFAFVHTVSLALPERAVYACDITDWREHPQLRSFVVSVTASLFSRSRRPAPAAAAVPLRALRVSMERDVKNSTVDRWVSYALRHAASEFELDLRLEPDPVCHCPDPDRFRFAGVGRPGARHAKHDASDQPPRSQLPVVNDEDDAASSDDDMSPRSWNMRQPPPQYTVPRGLFSCAALRSLRLGSCWLSPPAAISLPSLEALHLTHVLDKEDAVQLLISACPRLADLTLHACDTVTVLCLLDNTHLRRLALRCCHELATVAVDASELCTFEYRGAVPESTFLKVRGPGGHLSSVTSCKIDICGPVEDVVKLGSFLQLFASTKHLHLSSPVTVMGSSFVDLPEFPALRHLEINGCLPGSVDPAGAIRAVSTILHQAPNLEVLTLFFQAPPQDSRRYYCSSRARSEGKLLDEHHLHYNKYGITDYGPQDLGEPVPSCLGCRLRKVNLVHYQGGSAQRTLAWFLLGNSPALEMLYCGFAMGPQWIQKELMREIERWVINKTTRNEFH